MNRIEVLLMIILPKTKVTYSTANFYTQIIHKSNNLYKIMKMINNQVSLKKLKMVVVISESKENCVCAIKIYIK